MNTHLSQEASKFIVENMVDELILDSCIEIHWYAKMKLLNQGAIPMLDISSASASAASSSSSNKPSKSLKPSKSSSSSSLFASSLSSSDQLNGKVTHSDSKVVTSASILGGRYNMVQCPVCLEAVGGARFAPHLEKCLRGKQRRNNKINGTTNHVDNARSKKFNFPSLPIKPRKIRDTSDPHPNSLVIRIKLREGVPYGNTRRVGASTEEFEENKKNVQKEKAIEVIASPEPVVMITKSKRMVRKRQLDAT